MAKTIKEKLKALVDKVKTIKNIEIIIAIVAIAVIILLYSLFTVDKAKPKVKNQTATNTELCLTDEVEQKLCKVLSQINGAGKVEVMITYTGSAEKVIANTTSTHTNTSNSGGSISTSTSTVTQTPIIITSNGASGLYVTKQLMPEIVGVIVVAEGANNARVRLELMRAVQTILDINANNIEIFAMK